MNLVAIGISHKTSTVAVREKFFLSLSERELLLALLKSDPVVIEAFVFATCNRTEVYASILDNNDPEELLSCLFRVKNISSDQTSSLKKHFYIYSGLSAVRHLFQVAVGWDSLVVGEKQILGQVKEAFALSAKHAMMGKTFNVLSNLVVRAGKKVQHETQIGCGGSSISWAAVAMAEQLSGGLQNKSVLIFGTGKMGSLAANYLHKKAIKNLFVMNRTQEKAQALSEQIGCSSFPFWQIKELLTKVDVCICSTGAPHYVIEPDLVKEVVGLRKDKKIIFIDISVPRNINPRVAEIAGTRLVTIDDLDKVVKNNLEKRSQSRGQVMEIIDKKIEAFYSKMAKIQSGQFLPEHYPIVVTKE